MAAHMSRLAASLAIVALAMAAGCTSDPEKAVSADVCGVFEDFREQLESDGEVPEGESVNLINLSDKVDQITAEAAADDLNMPRISRLTHERCQDDIDYFKEEDARRAGLVRDLTDDLCEDLPELDACQNRG